MRQNKFVILGILFYLLYTLLFSLNNILIHNLQSFISSEFLTFIKSIGVFTVSLVLVILTKSSIKTKIFKWHFLRILVGTLMLIFFFKALKFSNIATVTVLGFLSPILASSLSILLFKEKTNKILLYISLPLSILGGFITLDIFFLKNSILSINFLSQGTIYGILSTLLFTIDILLTKKVAKDGNLICTFYSGSLGILISFLILIFQTNIKITTLPNIFTHNIFILELISFLFLYILAINLRIFSFKLANIQELMTTDTSRLIISPFIAFLFLNQIPNQSTILGGILIFCAIIITILNKNKNRS
jgi:drug/metabolite transporter (DMT)-like permease